MPGKQKNPYVLESVQGLNLRLGIRTFVHLSVDKLERVIRYKSDNKKTIRSSVEDSAVDYWAVHVGEAKNNNKHFYTMIEWF